MTIGPLDHRSSILGAVVGLLVGGVAGFVSGSLKVEPPAAVTVQAPSPSAVPSGPRRASAPPAQPLDEARPSFAQQGEDIVMQQMMFLLRIEHPTYLDIGAHDPIRNSNTYAFYAMGGHGVLVEPNPTFAAKLRKVRPRDVVLDVGVGTRGQREADYFLINGDGQFNTFSKAQADALVRLHGNRIEGVIKRKLVTIDSVLEQHFKDAAPDILSIDVEGLDYEILKTLDWKRWRPKVVCVETSNVENGEVEREILELLESKGYVVRGGSFVNTIFLDNELVKRAAAELAAKAAFRDAGIAKAHGDGGP